MNSVRFTHEYYLKLLQVLKHSERPVVPVNKFLQSHDMSAIILRHDVDRFAQQALRLAYLEAQQDVFSTYYFRCHPQKGLPQEIIQSIANLGHEVGYHYETLSRAKGDYQQAIELFKQNLKRFRQIANCQTVTAHGSPLSPYNNFNLLEHFDFKSVELFGDGALSLREKQLHYFTDTGGSWSSGSSTNFRDYVGQPPEMERITPENLDLFSNFVQRSGFPIYISTHPERWAHNKTHLLFSESKDHAINLIKHLLSLNKKGI